MFYLTNLFNDSVSSCSNIYILKYVLSVLYRLSSLLVCQCQLWFRRFYTQCSTMAHERNTFPVQKKYVLINRAKNNFSTKISISVQKYLLQYKKKYFNTKISSQPNNKNIPCAFVGATFGGKKARRTFWIVGQLITPLFQRSLQISVATSAKKW